jgi:hypothetical protein
MGLEDLAGNAIDDRFRDGADDLGRKRAEIFPSLGAKRNRSVTIVEDPISPIDLPVFPILRRYSIPLGLRKVVPYGRPIHEGLS